MSGDQVENMIAVALLRKYPKGVHVRASQGDGGIDIFVPTEGTNTGTNYQVKNFSRGLEDPQKAQIRKSLRATGKTTKEGTFRTTECFIVVPMNPTTAEVKWLNRHVKPYKDMSVTFFGLSHIEGLLTENPGVADYFVNNGEERLNSIVAEVIGVLRQVLGLTESAKEKPLTAVEIVDHLSKTVELVNKSDDFYRYEVATGRDPRFDTNDPDLIFSTAITGTDDSVVTISVMQRFNGATDFRPCSFTMRPIPATPEEEVQFEDFRKFGTPATFTAEYDANLPGGLGTENEVGKVTIGPAIKDGPPRTMRVDLLDDSKSFLAGIVADLTLASTGFNKLNHYFKLESKSRTLLIETRFDRENMQMSYDMTIKGIEGKVAVNLRDEFRFVKALKDASCIRISMPYGPLSKDVQDISGLPERSDWTSISVLIEDLSDIQKITNRPILVPQLDELNADDWAEIRRCAALSRNEEIKATWDRVKIHLNEGVTIDEEQSKVTLAAIMPLELTLGGKTYNLGQRIVHYKVAELESKDIDESGNPFAIYIPSGDTEATIKRILESN